MMMIIDILMITEEDPLIHQEVVEEDHDPIHAIGLIADLDPDHIVDLHRLRLLLIMIVLHLLLDTIPLHLTDVIYLRPIIILPLLMDMIHIMVGLVVVDTIIIIIQEAILAEDQDLHHLITTTIVGTDRDHLLLQYDPLHLDLTPIVVFMLATYLMKQDGLI